MVRETGAAVRDSASPDGDDRLQGSTRDLDVGGNDRDGIGLPRGRHRPSGTWDRRIVLGIFYLQRILAGYNSAILEKSDQFN
uniref:Uncharacterized protein n=1 Tax=Candidatus Kentrum sp. FW TaxID=2126338 RepID=A0A450TF78_9GAMM|nr:MAG: hypothetical protein BECKFW1821A_GA0114235_11076 [Candidatus Kentron sp. FW]VFJ65811.1 MAG: hypothetical protein BECKFW1821B_GA0114236_11077 [Candidatus Kentron sp. FW]